MKRLAECLGLSQKVRLSRTRLPRCRTTARWVLSVFTTILVGNLVSAQERGDSTLAATPNNMDAAIALLAESRQCFRLVHDYECRLVSQERVHGVLMPETVMAMKVRNNPFSIYLRGEGPKSEKGLEVCYVVGRNHGMMRVHLTGLLGILGFISVDPCDPRVFETNRHAITEAGISRLLEATAKYWEMERRLNKTVVHITDEELEGHVCTRIETIHPDRYAGSFYGFRCVLWLDKTTHLPTGAEVYDWPRQGGPAEGDLLERYLYLDLRCNVGLKDDVFAH